MGTAGIAIAAFVLGILAAVVIGVVYVMYRISNTRWGP